MLQMPQHRLQVVRPLFTMYKMLGTICETLHRRNNVRSLVLVFSRHQLPKTSAGEPTCQHQRLSKIEKRVPFRTSIFRTSPPTTTTTASASSAIHDALSLRSTSWPRLKSRGGSARRSTDRRCAMLEVLWHRHNNVFDLRRDLSHLSRPRTNTYLEKWDMSSSTFSPSSGRP